MIDTLASWLLPAHLLSTTGWAWFLWLLLPIFLFLLAFWLWNRWIQAWPGNHVTLHPVRASRFSPELVQQQQDDNSSWDTIVIGSGTGGCSCANVLAQSDQKVLLLEQHEERTGGCTHTFRQEGCEWDTGLHYTSQAMSLPTRRAGALLKFMTKGQQHWQRLEDPYDEIFFPSEEQQDEQDDDDGDNKDKNGNNNPNKKKNNKKTVFDHYEFCSGMDNVIAHVVERIDPGNTDLQTKCQTWMDLCTVVNQDFTALGWSRVLPPPTWWFPQWWLLRHNKIDELYQLASYTVRDVQYAIFNLGYTVPQLQKSCPKAPDGPEPDPVLRRVKAVLNHPIGDYAVQPRLATYVAQGITMAHYAEGAAYTVGPTQQISIRTSSMVTEMGGKVLCDATVEQILVEQGRAVGVRVRNTSAGKNGPTHDIYAKNVVCATSVFNLYHHLLPKDCHLPAVSDFMDVPTKRSIVESNGHVFLFCKLQGNASDLQLPTHNLWYFHSYNVDQAFDAYNADPRHNRPPTVYIGFPCTKDPTWSKRLPGVSNCILISDGQWKWFEKWAGTTVHERGEDYEEFKNQLAQHLIEVLYESVPQVQGKVEYWTLGTPLTDVSYLSSFHGGSYGTRCNVEIFTRKNSKWTTTPRTPIPNLYMAGADAFLPAVCGAMYGGILGAVALLGPLQSLRLTAVFLSDFATLLQEDNPKLSRPRAYALAAYKFWTELVAN